MALNYSDAVTLASQLQNLTSGIDLNNSPDLARIRTLATQMQARIMQGADPGTDAGTQQLYAQIQNLMQTSPQVQQTLNQNPNLQQNIQQDVSNIGQIPLPNIPNQSVTPPVQSTLPQNPVNPNLPLSTPNTPVNQSTAPSDINAYIPDTSTQQQNIINQSIAQSQGVAGQNVQSLQDILNPYVMSQVKNWTDPNSPDYQSTIGSLNNIGRADANTFGQSLSSRLAPLIAENQMKLGTNALLPSFLTQQDLVSKGAGVQSTLGMEPLNRFVELQNFNMQKDLANSLASQGASANLGSGIGGLLGGGLGAFAGNAIAPGIGGLTIGALLGSKGGSAAGGGAGGMTWICTHLKKLGLATESEVEAVHARLIPSVFRHPIRWLHYLHSAPRLIELCDMESMDWGPIKEVLIDAVLNEPDTEKAFQIYSAECKRLCSLYAPELWNFEVTPC